MANKTPVQNGKLENTLTRGADSDTIEPRQLTAGSQQAEGAVPLLAKALQQQLSLSRILVGIVFVLAVVAVICMSVLVNKDSNIQIVSLPSGPGGDVSAKSGSTNETAITTAKSYSLTFDVDGSNNTIWVNSGLHIDGDNSNSGVGQQLSAGDMNLPSQQQIKACECGSNSGTSTCCCSGHGVQCCAGVVAGQTESDVMKNMEKAVQVSTGEGSASSAGPITSGVSSCSMLAEPKK